MLFNSLAFAIFLPIVFALYWLMPKKHRYLVLAAAGCYFYLGFGVEYFGFLLLVTLVSFGGALLMERSEDRKRKKLCLGGVLAVSLGLLVFFKYYNFACRTLAEVLSLFTIRFTPAVLKFAAPVGISFYTFKVVSYMLDVYHGKLPAQRNFGRYAAYVSFFPQVASGPIERAESFFASMEEEKSFSYETASYGLKLMAWGFFKKMIIADKLSGYVTKVFSDVHAYSGFALIVAAVLFSVQIYCDFSGYSDIANGTARLFGYKGAENFRSPYFSSSVKEFWGRWHISLSSWLRDYIYIPLGGSRVGTLRYARNIMVTFLVSGLWHGAAWTFVVWGALHGAVQVLETLCHNWRARRRGRDPKDRTCEKKGFVKWLRVLLVFLFATAAWVFFKAESLSDAIYVFGSMFAGIGSPLSYVKEGFGSLGINSSMFVHLAIVVGLLAVFDLLSLKRDVIASVGRLPAAVRLCIYVLFLDLMIIWFLQYGADSGSFVYFQF